MLANETVGADELHDELRAIDAEGKAEYFVCVPANPVDTGQAEHKGAVWVWEETVKAAQARLDATLDGLRAHGVEATGSSATTGRCRRWQRGRRVQARPDRLHPCPRSIRLAAQGPGQHRPFRAVGTGPARDPQRARRRRSLRCGSRSSAGTARPAVPSAPHSPPGSRGSPLGRADWPHLAEAMAGCDAAYLIAPNLHPDEPAYVAAALDAARTAGVGRVVLHSVASPYAPGDAAPPRQGRGRGRRTPLRAAWTILQPGAYLQNLDLTRAGPVAYRADAAFGFADLAEVGRGGRRRADRATATTARLRARLAAYDGRRARRGGRRRRRGGHAPKVGATDGAASTPVRDWLLAMFAYYDAHGLPVGTLPLRALLGR